MPTPSGVNDLLQLLLHSDNFADFQITRIKSGRSSLLSLFCLCYVTIPFYIILLDLSFYLMAQIYEYFPKRASFSGIILEIGLRYTWGQERFCT